MWPCLTTRFLKSRVLFPTILQSRRLSGKMNLIYGVFLLICCFSFTEGNNLKKYPKKKLKLIKADLDSLDLKIAKLVEDTNKIVLCLNTSMDAPNKADVCTFPEEMLASSSARRLERTDVSDLDGDNKDVFWAANMYMSNGDRCGPRVSAQHLLTDSSNFLSSAIR